MKYTLGIDMGPTSIGAATIFLNKNYRPKAIGRTTVTIFNSGLTPDSGGSLAVTRRERRAARRNNDRYLKRRNRLMRKLIEYGFFPQDEVKRTALVKLNPYTIRAEGLDRQLTPQEFARAVFHLNQRRGFQSNRKSDKKDDDSKKMTSAINRAKQSMQDGEFRTVGEWLHAREKQKLPVRARLSKTTKTYDLYINRDMVKDEFNMLWDTQSKWNPTLFNKETYEDIFDTLFFQRDLRPGNVGRCTLDTEEKRAPKALPSSQAFRITQELNHLRIETNDHGYRPLTISERDVLMTELNKTSQLNFSKVRSLLGIGRCVGISHDNEKQNKLKGNTTNIVMSQDDKFGSAWFDIPLAEQDEIVEMILHPFADQDEIAKQIPRGKKEEELIKWLQLKGLSEQAAKAASQAGLAEGYGMLSKKTLHKLLPEMLKDVIPYSTAVTNTGFDSHSALDLSLSGEIMSELPYYGKVLVRHVAFPEDTKASIAYEEAEFGKISNPNVHIALNQLRKVVNAIIKKYGHPYSVVIEVARELKQSLASRLETSKEQKANENYNNDLRKVIGKLLDISPERVSRADIEKMKLWVELEKAGKGFAACPYSGVRISQKMVFTSEVEVEHILPYKETMDDSMSNKTLCMRLANRVKGKRSPWEASADFAKQGWMYKDIVERAKLLPEHKALRFLPDAMKNWLKDSSDFLARHLNDTRYIAKLTREYVSVICPQNTYVITGKHTALIRAKLGLNKILSSDGKKNRDDHRHHAIDACVIGITDRSLLQKISAAHARECDLGNNRLIGEIEPPFENFREHVKRAIENCIVHHKQDHSHTGAMMEATAHNPSSISGPKSIAISDKKALKRHGFNEDGSLRPYKSYESGSNHCVEIVKLDGGKWQYEFISTHEAYQIARKQGTARLRNKHLSQSGKPLIMRLMTGDMLQVTHDGAPRIVRVVKMTSGESKQVVYLIDHNEANVAARVSNSELSYIAWAAGTLQKSSPKKISVNYLGVVKIQKTKE